MIKLLHGASGYLTQPLHASAKKIVVNAELLAYIKATLEYGDWGYLQIQDAEKTEIVRWKNTPYLGVDRGIDSTIASSFSVGATVSHVPTAQEFLDAIGSTNLTLRVTEGLELHNGSIRYVPISIDELGATQAILSNEKIILGRDEQAYGCCGLDSPGAPPVPNPYIYITSRPYPLEIIENTYNGLSFSKSFLLELTVDNTYSQMEIQEVRVYGGAKNYSTLEYTYAELDSIQGLLYGGAKLIAIPGMGTADGFNFSEHLYSDLSVESAVLYGDLITYYDNTADERIFAEMTTISGTLT